MSRMSHFLRLTQRQTCNDFPEDDVNASICIVEDGSRIGDGNCDPEECNDDGGDCTNQFSEG